MRRIILLLLAFFSAPALQAGSPTPQADSPALLVIGASFANGVLPINEQMQGVLGGISVGLGSYLSLGQALTRNATLPGYVINEAQAGASTFDRINCAGGCTPNLGWLGYEKQLQRALMRVSSQDASTGASVVNAKYVVISLANDCLHSNAFGIPEQDTAPCSAQQVDDYIDRLIAVGRMAEDAGLTPIYEVYPAWEYIDLAYAQPIYGLLWMIGEADYRYLRDRQASRLRAEMPEAMVLDYWGKFEPMGDRFHPSPRATTQAAQRIADAIRQREAQAMGH